MNKIKELLNLFFVMFKVGLFTFGGGYAMVGVIEREITEKRKWLSEEEFLDVIAIAESTPGPLAVNTSTFVGYKRCGFWGAFFSTLGVILPSFSIILIISLFFDEFLKIKVVGYAFKGIQACVAFLIISAGIRLLLKLKPSVFNYIMFGLSLLAIVLISLFNFKFSTVFIILISGAVGLIVYFVSLSLNKKKLTKDCATKEEPEQKTDNNDSDRGEE